MKIQDFANDSLNRTNESIEDLRGITRQNLSQSHSVLLTKIAQIREKSKKVIF